MSSSPQQFTSEQDIEKMLNSICAELHPESEKQLRRIIKAKDTRADFKHEGWVKAGNAVKKERKLRKKAEQELAAARAQMEDEQRKAQEALEEVKDQRKELETQIQLLWGVIRSNQKQAAEHGDNGISYVSSPSGADRLL